MSERDAIVAVTEADREAYLSLNMLPEFDAADVRAGRWDKVTGIQAFARHRATHAAEVERLREALERIASSKTELYDKSDYAQGWNGARFRMSQIARQALEPSR